MARKKTVIVSFHIPSTLLDALDELVRMGLFQNRSEAIRVAVNKLIFESRATFNGPRRDLMYSVR